MSTALAPIKKWSVRHEMVVHMHIAQYSNEAIAEKLNLTPVRVSQILNDPQAKQIIRGVKANMLQTLEDDISGRLALLAKESVDRIAETIEFSGFTLGSDAKKHQDNISLGFLKGVGILNGEKEGEKKQAQNLAPALAERLITALEKSNEAEAIRSAPVVEAEVEIVEDEK